MGKRLAAALIALVTAASAGTDSALAAADAASPGAGNVSPANEKIAAGLKRVLGCAERLWPGWRAEKLHLLVIDVPAKNAVLLTGGISSFHAGRIEHELTSVPYQPLAAQFGRPGLGFAFMPWPKLGEVLAVYHSAANAAELDHALEVAIHEAFHMRGQGGFVRAERVRAGSTQHYPQDASARYVRHELMRSLKRAAAGESPGAAAYWATEFAAKHVNAGLEVIDRIEGSAEYVAAFGVAAATHGCDEDDAALVTRALAYADRKWQRALAEPERPNEVREAHVIGVYAGLRLQRAKHSTWQAAVERGRTLLELAVEGVAPAPQEIDKELLDRIEGIVAARNATTRSQINALNESLRSPDHIIMSAPASRLGPAVAPQGIFSYVSEDGKNLEIVPRTRLSLLLGREGGTLALRDIDVRFEGDTPCGSAKQLIFPVSRANVTRRSDDRVDVSYAGINAKNIKVTSRSRDGVDWLCVSAN